MDKKKKRNFKYFVGIDVSKNKLDYAVVFGKELLFHQESKNQPEAITVFMGKLRELPGFTFAKSLFCMEDTGFYCNYLLHILKTKKAFVVVENPIQIKNSIGMIRGKNDKDDAVRIAMYAQKNSAELRQWVPKRTAVSNLDKLLTIRERLLRVAVALRVPLNEQASFIGRNESKLYGKLCEQGIKGVKLDINGVDQSIKQLIDTDEHLKKLNAIITSVPCVGVITAMQIIITTNEFKDIRCAKKFACYSGVAPFKKESGLIVRKSRVSHLANKNMKRLLHLCALGAVRFDGELRSYYEKKTLTEGKSKMLVINAVRNKLIARIFACVNQDRYFQKDYSKFKA
ncbi:IS110 family RNA-guided transposase [Mucilaginibacter sp.]